MRFLDFLRGQHRHSDAGTVFTITGGAGTKRLTATGQGSSSGNPPTTAEFQAILSYFDQHSFTVALVIANGFCSEAVSIYLIRI